MKSTFNLTNSSLMREAISPCIGAWNNNYLLSYMKWNIFEFCWFLTASCSYKDRRVFKPIDIQVYYQSLHASLHHLSRLMTYSDSETLIVLLLKHAGLIEKQVIIIEQKYFRIWPAELRSPVDRTYYQLLFIGFIRIVLDKIHNSDQVILNWLVWLVPGECWSINLGLDRISVEISGQNLSPQSILSDKKIIWPRIEQFSASELLLKLP